MWKTFILKWLKRIGIAFGVLILIALIPIARNEISCVESPLKATTGVQSILQKDQKRDEINTYLTYPEWMIVHAYEDFAGITRQSSESDFAYFKNISTYWSSLCDVSRQASQRGQISSEYRTMLYVIGLSFTAEFGIKGAYENTIGAITAWLRGDKPTPEDEIIRDISDDYAEFLQQAAWFEYSFWGKLKEFWTKSSWSGGNWVRKIERRFSMSMEYSVKALYGQVIGFGASVTMPGKQVVYSVVEKLEPSDISTFEDIKIVQTRSEGVIIETPRYRRFTKIIQALAGKGINFQEIAGNDDILVTVLVPPGKKITTQGTTTLFKVPIQSKPGWKRLALNVKVNALTELIRTMETSQITLEHVYDY